MIKLKELEFKISTDGVFPRSVCDGGVQGDEAATDIVFKIEKDLKAELVKLQEGGYRLQFRIDITDGGGGLIATDALTVDLAAETPEITYTVGQDISSVGGIANFFLIISAFDSDNNLCLDKYSYPCRVRFYPSAATAEKAKSETFSGALADAVKKADDRANAAMTSADEAETSASSAADSAAAAGSSASEAADSAAAAGSSASEAAASAANASASAAAAASSASEAANSVTAAAGSASEAAASAASAALSAEAVNPDSYYKKDAADKQFAERSSENSADPSSVAYAKAMWIKQDDTGENSAAFLWDEFPDESPTILWSSEKTMETVREERGKLSANAVKKTVSGQTVQINDASPLIHELDISVSKNIFPKTYNILHDKFSFSGGAVTGTVEADGKIVVNINSRTTETLAFDVCTFNLGSGTKYIYSGNPHGCSYGSYFSRITRTSGAEMHPLTTDTDTEFTVDYGGEFKFTILIQAHKDPQQIVFTPRLGVADAADEVEVIEYDGGGNVAARVTPEADGTVKGIKSYPTMKITTNNSAYAVNVTYNRDLNRVVEELQQAIISLGGNV